LSFAGCGPLLSSSKELQGDINYAANFVKRLTIPSLRGFALGPISRKFSQDAFGAMGDQSGILSSLMNYAKAGKAFLKKGRRPRWPLSFMLKRTFWHAKQTAAFFFKNALLSLIHRVL